MSELSLLTRAHDYVETFEWKTGETPMTSLQFLVTVHVVYTVILMVLTKVMETREAPKEFVKNYGFIHNIFMSVLSLVMLIGLLWGAWRENRFVSMETFLCNRVQEVQPGLVQFSMYIFYLSKMTEFIDTFLLVLSKKKLIWLHKVHHLTTMSLVWHAQHINQPSEILCGGLNCFVHVIMYFYFAKPIKFIRPWITITQISQFVLVLMAISYASYRRYTSDFPCQGTEHGEWHGELLYGVYLTMFANFFVQQYLNQNCAKPKKEPRKNDEVRVGGEINMLPPQIFEADAIAAVRVLAKTLVLGIGGIVCFAKLPDSVGIPVGIILVSMCMSWLYLVGQDCSQTIFFKSKWLNNLVGTIALLPLLRPLQSVRLQQQEYNNWFTRLVQKFFGLSVSHFAVYFFSVCFIPYLVSRFGWTGLFRYWFLPFVVMHMNVKTFKKSKSTQPAYKILFPELSDTVSEDRDTDKPVGKSKAQTTNKIAFDLTNVPLYHLQQVVALQIDPSGPRKSEMVEKVWDLVGLPRLSKELLLWKQRDWFIHAACSAVLCMLVIPSLSYWSGSWAPVPFVMLVVLSFFQTASFKRARPVQAPVKKEILIEDRIYDITEFASKHPGGRIINFQAGTDATAAFREFHSRSKKARAVLKTLLPKSRIATAEDLKHFSAGGEALLKDFEQLRTELENEGYFKPSLVHVVYRISELLLMHASGVYCLIWGSHVAVQCLGVLLLGIAQGRCGWFMHEGGHNSLTGNITIDRNIQMFFYGVGCGMSGAFWRNQHNKHHATPQKLKHDVDLDTLPFVAFNKAIIEKIRNPFVRRWLSYQGYLFAPLSTLLVTLGWQCFLHPRHCIRTGEYVELFYILLRHVLWGVGKYVSDASWYQLVMVYMTYNYIGGFYIFLNFSVSHTHKPVVDADQHIDWVRYAANHTTNCTPSLLCNWWMSYLNFQIEHHLFPSMPQFRHPQIAPRVKQLFEKHGLVYDVRDYWTCMADTFRNLHVVGQVPVSNTMDIDRLSPANTNGKGKKKVEIILRGKVIDVTRWMNKHPGGSKVLHLFNNRNADEQFDAFHSIKATTLLETMVKSAPSVPIDHQAYESADSEMAKKRAVFNAFACSVEEKGFFKHNNIDEIIKFLVSVGLWCVGLYTLTQTGWVYSGAVMFAIAMQQCGWVGHDYSHHSVFASPWLNDKVGHLFAWLQGYELGWWKARHNTHHVLTNEVGSDPDIRTQPLFTYFVPDAKSLNWLQKKQHLYFVPALGLLHLYWRLESIMFILVRLTKEPSMWLNAAALTGHYWMLYHLISSSSVPTPAILFCMYCKGMFTGLCVFSTHYGEDRLPINHKYSFAEQTVMTSRNIKGGWLINWFSGHISLQIEHHLFPRMPTSNYRKVQPLVREFCLKNGLTYKEDSLLDCVKLNIQTLKVNTGKFNDRKKIQ